MKSKDWLNRQKKDYFVKKAKKEGYLSRAAYKLIEIETKFKILKKTKTLVFISCETQKLGIIDLFNAENNTNVSCYRIPSIITAPNGDLIAMIDERVPSCGDLKWSRDINIVMRKSFDNGKTWTDIETVVDYPLGQSASDPSMILDEKTNTIFMFYNYMDLDNEKDIYYLRYKKSVDNGKSWSESIDITDQISKSGWEKDFKFITSGRGIQTQDGTLLHCLVNLQKGTHVFGSNDNGDTWFIAETPTSPGDESKIIELNDTPFLKTHTNQFLKFFHIFQFLQ